MGRLWVQDTCNVLTRTLISCVSESSCQQKTPTFAGLSNSGGGIRTRDLRVMSPIRGSRLFAAGRVSACKSTASESAGVRSFAFVCGRCVDPLLTLAGSSGIPQLPAEQVDLGPWRLDSAMRVSPSPTARAARARRNPASIMLAKLLSVVRDDKYMANAYPPAWHSAAAAGDDVVRSDGSGIAPAPTRA